MRKVPNDALPLFLVLGGLLLELLRFLTPADAAVGRLAPPVVQALLPKQ